jgi:C-terminal processing protease CtpA/Prc
VLTGANTSSAGEFTLIALRGRANLRVFGTTTSGFVSANKTVPLPDGANLIVSSAWSADRTGRTYTGPIAPDQAETSSQAAVRAAEAWAGRSCR